MATNKFTCPRRVEQGMDDDSGPFRHSGKNLDTWNKREGHDTCSYCGSVKPEAVLIAIEDGYEIGTTDKSYKIYINLPGDGKKRSRGSANFPQAGYKKVPFKKEWRAPAEITTIFHGKFYFQHFSKEQQHKFIQLVNDKKVKYSGGFGFYVLPYFVTNKKEDK